MHYRICARPRRASADKCLVLPAAGMLHSEWKDTHLTITAVSTTVATVY
jgi:hypothetical protein